MRSSEVSNAYVLHNFLKDLHLSHIFNARDLKSVMKQSNISMFFNCNRNSLSIWPGSLKSVKHVSMDENYVSISLWGQSTFDYSSKGALHN
ncbi:MAG: hypothetical protein HXX13_04040 [Bacteroidetes bacterium]|nr:hypothetical protein [Bacteroidota bacterium]